MMKEYYFSKNFEILTLYFVFVILSAVEMQSKWESLGDLVDIKAFIIKRTLIKFLFFKLKNRILKYLFKMIRYHKQNNQMISFILELTFTIRITYLSIYLTILNTLDSLA